MRASRATLCLFSISVSLAASAQQATTMTGLGYTGLGITPNARLLSWGRFEEAYENDLAGVVPQPRGHSFITGFGLLPNLEIAGRLATTHLNRNCFVDTCSGIRDLSASAKLAIGLDAARRYSIAAGATDVGGAATNFRSYYGVLTYSGDAMEASAGWAKRPASRPDVTRSPLDGPFASAAWSPLPWIRGQVEYSDKNSWAGVRVFAPSRWLPQGWAAYVGVNQRLTTSTVTNRSWVSAGVSIPLFEVPDLPRSRRTESSAPTSASGLSSITTAAASQRAEPAPVAATGTATTPAPAAAPPARLDRLAAALKAAGFEDISVGRMPDTSVAVRVNNASYNWNTTDAVGAALGVIARELGQGPQAYRLVLTQRQVPVVAVTGQADCLAEWVGGQVQRCTAGELSTPGTGALERLLDGVQWEVANLQPSWKTPRLHLSPVLRTTVGTELGALDYSLGVNAGLELPLWAGARAEVRRDVPLANSSNFERTGAFGFKRVQDRLERLALTQTVRVPLERWMLGADDATQRKWGLSAVAAQGTIGRIGGTFDGALGVLRWEPGQGEHRFTVQAGRFRNSRFGEYDAPGPRNATPLLAAYRYNVSPTRTYLEATAGQFFNNDRGVQLGLRQWFSDVSVGVYYRRTRFQGQPARQFAGIEISVPIGSRHEWTPSLPFQVTGTPRFSHAVETVIRNNGINPILSGSAAGMLPPAPSIEETFNSDRSGLVYFEDNVLRIRDAAQ